MNPARQRVSSAMLRLTTVVGLTPMVTTCLHWPDNWTVGAPPDLATCQICPEGSTGDCAVKPSPEPNRLAAGLVDAHDAASADGDGELLIAWRAAEGVTVECLGEDTASRETLIDESTGRGIDVAVGGQSYLVGWLVGGAPRMAAVRCTPTGPVIDGVGEEPPLTPGDDRLLSVALTDQRGWIAWARSDGVGQRLICVASFDPAACEAGDVSACGVQPMTSICRPFSMIEGVKGEPAGVDLNCRPNGPCLLALLGRDRLAGQDGLALCPLEPISTFLESCQPAPPLGGTIESWALTQTSGLWHVVRATETAVDRVTVVAPSRVVDNGSQIEDTGLTRVVEMPRGRAPYFALAQPRVGLELVDRSSSTRHRVLGSSFNGTALVGLSGVNGTAPRLRLLWSEHSEGSISLHFTEVPCR